MIKRITPHNRRLQERPAFKRHLARPVPILRRHVLRPRHLQIRVNRPVDVLRHLRIRKTRQLRVLIIRRHRLKWPQPLRQRLRNLLPILRHNHRRRIDARPPAIVRNRRHHHIQMLAPVLDLILPNDDLRPPRPVHLHRRIVLILLHRPHIAKHQTPPAQLHHLTRPLMVRRIKAKRLRRRTRRNERLNQPKRRPRLVLARLDEHRRLQCNRRQPQTVHRRRIARHHQPQTLRRRKIRHRTPRLLAKPVVDHTHVQPARQPVQNHLHVRQRKVQLRHVPPHHHMRQTTRLGQRRDVLLRTLRVPPIPQRQRPIQKQIPRLRTDLNQFGNLKLLQTLPRLPDLRQILPHNPRIHLAHLRHHLPRLVVFDLVLFQTVIRLAFTEGGKMGDAHDRKIEKTKRPAGRKCCANRTGAAHSPQPAAPGKRFALPPAPPKKF